MNHDVSHSTNIYPGNLRMTNFDFRWNTPNCFTDDRNIIQNGPNGFTIVLKFLKRDVVGKLTNLSDRG